VAERAVVQLAQRFDGFAVREIGHDAIHQAAEGAEKSGRQVSGSRLACSRKWWSSSSFFSGWLPCGKAVPPAQTLRTAAARIKF
ncbi:MAG TPA: hypothetical protein VFP38_03675, partial [Bradyrhizobium sp.]|nr:hypothetical protein [Bradyrhizobium sp.]